jgi:hypothetical protein
MALFSYFYLFTETQNHKCSRKKTNGLTKFLKDSIEAYAPVHKDTDNLTV